MKEKIGCTIGGPIHRTRGAIQPALAEHLKGQYALQFGGRQQSILNQGWWALLKSPRVDHREMPAGHWPPDAGGERKVDGQSAHGPNGQKCKALATTASPLQPTARV
ncbi:hypothetical protein FHR70_002594 [Microvirga lupini]|uniref:Uncharacterized protein n=1 Tax=Microvirga lupini TaxID=420324 RepID=A0A7W4VLR4_9HYPH|nr:hypothetical protein [Microvirga lupini]